ncbi:MULTISPECIES: DNA polymerase III subunit alpha [Idiomarina]|uniref:DNA polymerase III subunit alpha n=1 Tax=Idiomarina TaxID=135575 RepID=UPI000C438B1C|nr:MULTISPECIES: DNA polymerase III subunit alpha [Idiomarina]MAB21046.1 DNA polymerase III subunit alpha [Idiomarina sp.]MBH95615.1 DNA polymerase III subunit alpha [Idiomarina sp.]MBP59833.1 DNA polymerase III subunit alpha [Idiomarina sp.]QZN90094.1 DNA polymerase III subunit alpha [Idiomarina abyssalis]HAS14298.1 DNA polymerase III subunit alpha [Idiomarina abyssalis]
MTAPNFVHLRIHSDFSMIDGLAKVGPICEAVADAGMPALAITDQMNFCGLVRYYGAAHKLGLKPLIGCDFWVQADYPESELFRLTALAMDNEGYQQITQLISKAYLRGNIKGKPVIDKDWLKEHNEGIILLSGSRQGDVGQALIKGHDSQLDLALDFYQQYFPNRYYLELVRTGRPQEEDYLHKAVALAGQTELPVVATNEVVFLKEEDFDPHEIRVAIHDGYQLEDKRRPKKYSPQQYLRSSEEMIELFSDIPEAIENTVEIAKRCNVTVRLGEYFLPKFPTGDLTTEAFLIKASEEGLEERLEFLFPDAEERQQKRPEYDERLKRELGVINDMGFPGYFLIVMEFIQWSKDNGIPVGPGRGSGAGSLVAYALKITDLDPLEFDLLFERFLNPERVSMPDFDVDFCMDRRDEVIDHVADLYGRGAVSQIITFGTMAAKAAIRDVGRVLGHPYGFVDRISKLVPGDPGMTLAKAFEVEPQLGAAYEQDEEVKAIIDMARILEGVTRNAGKHAGGVVISPTKITDFSPLYCDDEGNNPVTQFDKDDVESAGLVKFDFLGLRTLTIIQWAVDMVNRRHAKSGKDPIDITAIDLTDPACFKLLKKAETTAVFQLESRGMKELIKKLLPDSFEDIIALVALFRPGPLQSGMVDNFIDRKHGREEISYPDVKYQHDSLQPILEPTYGVILYQEQVMQIAQVLAGYTLGGADLLRRAMGKKKPEEMAKQREIFREGAAKNNIDPELAMKIFDLVEKFAGYGFNKSHSAAYALVSYQTLWMKTHYPAEFMAAVMSADMDNTDKIVTLADECERMGLDLLPPDVNKGEYKFTVDEQQRVVYGIGAIKGVGEGPIESIIQARQEGGPFRDLFDFCCRVDLKRMNKRILERLIRAGAMDNLGPHRAALMATLEKAIRQAEQHLNAEKIGQSDMFGVLTTEPEAVEQEFVSVRKWSEAVWLEGERDTLGLYLTGHPINRFRKELKHYINSTLSSVTPTRKDESIAIAGLVIDIRVLTNKRGQRFAIVTLDDKTARMDVRLFSNEYESYQELLEKDRILWVKGEVRFDNFSNSNTMTAREVMAIEQARETYLRHIAITVTDEQLTNGLASKLEKLLKPFAEGTCPIKMRYQSERVEATLNVGAQWYVNPSDELLYELQNLLGTQQVSLEF